MGNPYKAVVFVVGTEQWPKCVGPGVRPKGDRRRQQTPIYTIRFLQRQNTGKQEYFEMILARTQQNRKAPHFLYAKENTVLLHMKEAPRGAV